MKCEQCGKSMEHLQFHEIVFFGGIEGSALCSKECHQKMYKEMDREIRSWEGMSNLQFYTHTLGRAPTVEEINTLNALDAQRKLLKEKT